MSAFYHEVWLIYCLALLGFVLVIGRLTRYWPLTPRVLLLAFLTAFFATPWSAIADEPSLTPAFMIVLVEAFTGGSVNRGLVPILMAFVLMLLVSLSLYLLLGKRTWPGAKSSDEAEPAYAASANTTNTVTENLSQESSGDNLTASEPLEYESEDFVTDRKNSTAQDNNSHKTN